MNIVGFIKLKLEDKEGTDKVMKLIRKTIPFLTEDRYLHEDIMKATDIISSDENINEIVDFICPEVSNI